MELEEYARVAAAEDDHWWYRNTRALMRDLLAPWLGTATRVLDAGCGTGGNGAWLAEHGRVVGIDLADEALRFVAAGRPEITPVRASVERLPFADRSFDVAVAVTVVYAVHDDTAAIAELARVLRNGAPLLLVEPAFPSLARAHDRTVHGIRRYRRAPLSSRLHAAGLVVRRATYAYSFLAPPAAALALADRALPSRGDHSPSDVERRWLDPVFRPLADAERRYLTRRDVPFGTSLVILATRAS